ncbi:MAG: AAA family ATPase, partial [Rhodocyclaceae bacterium]|nr:AAA family ATPase [Rhodocyclaceae bacterium]
MTSRIVAVVSQKGGAGKTTVLMQIAGGLAEIGRGFAIADLDPQESALRWSELAADAGSGIPVAEPVAGDGAAARLRKLARARELLLVDCPPSIEHAHTLAALDVADLVLVPVVPGPTDLWSTRAVESLILQKQKRRKSLAGFLLPNRVPRTRLAAEIVEFMQEFSLPLLPVSLGQRNAYAESALAGGSVFQLGRPAESAREEVRGLVRALLKELE